MNLAFSLSTLKLRNRVILASSPNFDKQLFHTLACMYPKILKIRRIVPIAFSQLLSVLRLVSLPLFKSTERALFLRSVLEFTQLLPLLWSFARSITVSCGQPIFLRMLTLWSLATNECLFLEASLRIHSIRYSNLLGRSFRDVLKCCLSATAQGNWYCRISLNFRQCLFLVN
mgnify:CR=1 FL=1